MALYECECEDCLARFEIRRSIKENSPFFCPQCQGKARILLYPATVIYKGSGFYTTDNKTSHKEKPSTEFGKDGGEESAE